ncbi:hypothetical protein O9H85_25425 [Paenibacillus filicis]|uniref:Uncharacterized protein n=1 Tax=Paenibacillus gyeongsangnamensis TaxID=3388067 RepID=A0ABT4QG23_9BACL|nr:hypothetical protein [Paenibacillus filicis]MCZ8515691.1 hypothetical protein [Paenibacillus filicis]
MTQVRPIVYRSTRYGFTLQIPGWWRPYICTSGIGRSRETEAEYHFRFKYKGRAYDDVFALLVFRLSRREWLESYGDSPYVYISEQDGRVFAYVTPEELPEAFIDKKTGEYDFKRFGTAIALLKRMVNRDVPLIAKTLRFRRGGLALPSAPFRSRKVRWRNAGW